MSKAAEIWVVCQTVSQEATLVTDAVHRERIEQIFGTKVSLQPGKNKTEILKALEEKEIHAMYIIGENPVVSDANLNHTHQLFENLDFLVVQDIMMTQTAQLADVVLPAAVAGRNFRNLYQWRTTSTAD